MYNEHILSMNTCKASKYNKYEHVFKLHICSYLTYVKHGNMSCMSIYKVWKCERIELCEAWTYLKLDKLRIKMHKLWTIIMYDEWLRLYLWKIYKSIENAQNVL